MAKEMQTDVLIVGSGPVGATYAKLLVDQGLTVHMVEVGAQESPIPGEHKKNAINFQKDVNQFVNVVNGDLFSLSVPVAAELFPNIDPESVPGIASISNGQNPRQNAKDTLDAKATRGVGGMSAHWTCCTPEMKAGIELPDCYDEKKWAALYDEARGLIRTSTTQFENSIRQQLVKRHLNDVFGDKREFKAMSLACHRYTETPEYVNWSSSATIFGDITARPGHPGNPKFTLLAEHQCVTLQRDVSPEGNGTVKWAVVKDLRKNTNHYIFAKRYVICAGAVLTPQILWNSGFNESHPALGRYMTEQVMTFCQIIMNKNMIKLVETDHWNLGWKKIVEHHKKKYPKDPIPIPFKDPDPQVTTQVTEEHPWHTQIHRDAFSYGLVPDIYDQRTIVDLRWFGYVKPTWENRVEFDWDIRDMYGMPQPTFFFKLGPEDSKRANAQMTDMINVATKLGGFLPGAQPQFLTPGSALHICGTTRVGESVDDSVVDKHSRVHGSHNLFLCGCNVIPTQNAVNPTLTAICFAIEGARTIIADLAEKNGTA